MAGNRIDLGSMSGSSKGGARPSSAAAKQTAKAAGGGLSNDQKVKGAIAAVVLVLALGWIAYTMGLIDFSSGGGSKLTEPPPPTPEQAQQLQQKQDQVKRQIIQEAGS